jgi:hypothetical protein
MTDTISAASTAKDFTVADYSDAIIRITGVWDGNVEFYASNNNSTTTGNLSAIAVQDLESTNWTTAVTSEAGASPSIDAKMFRVPVAGLTNLVVKSASGFTGSVVVIVTAVSNTNAR